MGEIRVLKLMRFFTLKNWGIVVQFIETRRTLAEMSLTEKINKERIILWGKNYFLGERIIHPWWSSG